MDLCWKKLAERMEEEVLDKYKVEESKERHSEAELPLGMYPWYARTRAFN